MIGWLIALGYAAVAVWSSRRFAWHRCQVNRKNYSYIMQEPNDGGNLFEGVMLALIWPAAWAWHLNASRIRNYQLQWAVAPRSERRRQMQARIEQLERELEYERVEA